MNRAERLLFKAPGTGEVGLRLIDMDQGSDEWHDWRMSVIGASVGYRAMRMSKALFDHYTGARVTPDFDNKYTRHGNEHEAAARFQYECERSIVMTPTCAQRGFVGASADGVNMDAGNGCEIKCLNRENHIKQVRGEINPERYHQCQQSMYVFDFPKWELVSYYVSVDGEVCDPLPSDVPAFHIQTIVRDDSYIEKMVERLSEFWRRVQARKWPDDEKTALELAQDIQKPDAPALVVCKGVPDELANRAGELVGSAGSLLVTDQQSSENAVDMIKGLRGLRNKLEDTRKGVIEPHREYISKVNNLFKSVTEQIKIAGDGLNERLGLYQQEEKRKRQEERKRVEAEALRVAEEEQARLRKAREAAEEAARNAPDAVAARKARDEASKAARMAEEAEARAAEEARQRELQARLTTPARGISAAASTRKTWRFEVIDLTKVPRKWLVLDEKAVRAAVNDGKRKIAGLKIYQKETTIVR